MTKKESNLTRRIRHINLSLPVVQTDSYEIYYTIPPTQTRQSTNVHPISHQKPLIDNNRKTNNQTTNFRSPNRFKHFTGPPVLVNLFVNMPPMPTDSSLNMADTISNALINSGYSGQTLRALPAMAKRHQRQSIKDGSDRSRSSSGDKLLYDSIGSFEDCNLTKAKNGMWQNIHHPQLTTVKVLHARQTSRATRGSNEMRLRVPNTSSLENLSQESVVSTNERLYDKIENLTKSYFPVIQQLRHGHPCPELINNRMHLHREEKRDFFPVLSRTRVVR
jgi:hypothetical protein